MPWFPLVVSRLSLKIFCGQFSDNFINLIPGLLIAHHLEAHLPWLLPAAGQWAVLRRDHGNHGKRWERRLGSVRSPGPHPIPWRDSRSSWCSQPLSRRLYAWRAGPVPTEETHRVGPGRRCLEPQAPSPHGVTGSHDVWQCARFPTSLGISPALPRQFVSVLLRRHRWLSYCLPTPAPWLASASSCPPACRSDWSPVGPGPTLSYLMNINYQGSTVSSRDTPPLRKSRSSEGTSQKLGVSWKSHPLYFE